MGNKIYYNIQFPRSLLEKYIQYYWIIDADNHQQCQRVIPSGEVQLIFHYKKPFKEIMQNGTVVEQPQSLICGQATRFKDVIATENTGLIGVVFHPYAAKAFFRPPVYEFSNRSVHLSEIIKGFHTIENKIPGLADNDQRIDLIETFLLKEIFFSNLHHNKIAQESIRKINAVNGQVQPHELRKEFHMSERQYERIFREYIGVSPRQYIEISKFKYALSLMGSQLNMTEIAYKSGYYDQASFCRTVKKYTGYTPKEYELLQLL